MPMMTSSSSSRPLDPAAMRDHAMMRLAFCKWKSTASVTPIASPSSPTAVKSRAASSLSVTTSQPEATTRTSTIRSSNRPGGGSADSRPLTMVELLRSLDSQVGAAPPPPLETVAASPPPASTGGQPLGASSGMGTSSSRPLVSATREDYPREGSSAGRRPSASLRSALRPLHRHQASPTLASSVRTALGGGGSSGGSSPTCSQTGASSSLRSAPSPSPRRSAAAASIRAAPSSSKDQRPGPPPRSLESILGQLMHPSTSLEPKTQPRAVVVQQQQVVAQQLLRQLEAVGAISSSSPVTGGQRPSPAAVQQVSSSTSGGMGDLLSAVSVLLSSASSLQQQQQQPLDQGGLNIRPAAASSSSTSGVTLISSPGGHRPPSPGRHAGLGGGYGGILGPSSASPLRPMRHV